MDSERHNCNANIAFRDAFTGNELLVAGYYSDTWSWGPAAAYDLRYDGPLRRLGWQSRCPLWPPQGKTIAVFMPITRPAESSSGAPELPGLIVACGLLPFGCSASRVLRLLVC
jgi:hypothetical protein